MTCRSAIGGEMAVLASDLCGSNDLTGPVAGFPAHQVNCDTGRSALRLALRHWRKQGGRARIFVPEFICTSVISACRNEKFEIRLFHDRPGENASFEPPAPEDGDIVLAVHYFGFRNRPFQAWLQCGPRNRNWAVIEDCVQAPYTTDVGTNGDYVITSMRKWWPTPDGAVLAARWPLDGLAIQESNDNFVSLRLAAKLLRGASWDDDVFLPLLSRSEEMLDEGEPRLASKLSSRILGAQICPTALQRRKENWNILNQGLALGVLSSSYIEPLYSKLEAGVVPLTFPVIVREGHRDQLRAALAERGIYCPIHWLLPSDIDVSDLAMRLSTETLSFPIDQRCDQSSMQKILSELSAIVSFRMRQQ